MCLFGQSPSHIITQPSVSSIPKEFGLIPLLVHIFPAGRHQLTDSLTLAGGIGIGLRPRSDQRPVSRDHREFRESNDNIGRWPGSGQVTSAIRWHSCELDSRYDGNAGDRTPEQCLEPLCND
jgi:hypothetical protein